MNDVREICPGVYASADGISFCPGCGCLALGMDPASPEDVKDWTKATFAALRDKGVAWATEAKSAEVAESYLREPWHDY